MAITAFDLLISLGVDSSGVRSGLSSAQSAVSGFANQIGGVFSFAAKGGLMALEHGIMGLANGAEAVIGGVMQGAQAIGSLTQQAVAQYGEYEQMVGGTKLTFGEASDYIMQKSEKAFKNVQMSATEYLRQVNGFGTGLKVALGGDAEAAAKLSDRIINAEADMVAAKGLSQEMVQNAFMGVMRNNFTMLDNLQLGINPTKQGMEDLINIVNEFNATTEGRTATNYQMGNLADMESALVDYIEMQGMSGYATREAADTIQGSMASMKAAWEDLVTGLANKDADIGTLITNFVDVAIATLETNLLPTIENTLTGIADFIDNFAPVISEKLPEMIDKALPGFMNGIRAIMQAIATALPEVAQMVLTELPGLVGEFGKLVVSGLYQALNAIKELLPMLPDFLTEMGETLKKNGELIAWVIRGIINTVVGFVRDYLKENKDSILAGILQFIRETVEELPGKVKAFIDSVIEIGNTIKDVLVTNILPMIRNEIVPMVMNLFSTIVQELPAIIGILTEIIKAIVETISKTVYDNASDFIGLVLSVVKLLAQAAIDLLPVILEAALKILKDLADAIATNLEPFMEMVLYILNEVVGMLFENLPTLLDTAIEILETIVQAIAANAARFMPAVVDIIFMIINGLTEMTPVLVDAFTQISLILTHVIEDNLPLFMEKGMEVIGSLIAGLIENSYAIISAIAGIVVSVFETFTQELTRKNWAELGWQILEGILKGFESAFYKITDAVSSFGSHFLSTVQNVLGIHSPSRLMADKVGKFLALGIGEGFEDYMPDLEGMINTDFNIKGAPGGYGGQGGQIVVPVYLGNRLLQTAVAEANAKNNYMTGGR